MIIGAIAGLCDDPRWPVLIAKAQPYQDTRDDEGHSATVVRWAAALLATEETSAEAAVVLPAALLHDVGWSSLTREEKEPLFRERSDSPTVRALRLRHEQEGVRLARVLLGEAGYSEAETAAICALIDGHDTRARDINASDGVFRDADALWMVTNVGFAADVRRREVTAREWASWLEERFQRGRPFFTARAKAAAAARVALLREGRRVPPPGEDERRTILICHYRVGWTDGVSLEIEKRQSILEEMGFRCLRLAGPNSNGADFVVDDLDFDTPLARKISRNAFGTRRDYGNEGALLADIERLAGRIEEEISAVFASCNPDFILLHNIFSHGRHIAAAQAFYHAIRRYGAPALATHHDFYWERDDFSRPSGEGIEAFLTRFVPPVIPGMKHAVINSLAARTLLNKTGIDAMIFPDTLDFTVERWEKDAYNAHILTDFGLREDDLYILQATRIVRRKGIELIPPLIAHLNRPEYLDQLRGRTLYNGKRVGKEARFVFLLAGYAEQEALDYQGELEGLMEASGIPYRFLRSRIAAERNVERGKRVYSLFDTYPYADVVSYPSLYEGWGNQFIEGVFAEKPIIVHEYPVFRSDILPKGYDIISLGSEVRQGDGNLVQLPRETLHRVCQEVVDWLLSAETPGRLERNFQLAESNNSYDYLRALMRQSMDHYDRF